MPLNIREEFITGLRTEMHTYPIHVILRGDIPLATMFAIIKRSLQKVHEVATSRGEPFPWDQLFNIMFDSYERLISQSTHGEAPKAKTKVPSTQPVNISQQQSSSRNNVMMQPSSAAKKDNNSRSSLQDHKPVIQIPPVEEVLMELNHYAASPKLYARPGQKYIKCKQDHCSFCTAMFEHMVITPCSRFGHANCNTVGWFPHVGISLWKSLRSQHDAGMPFKPRTVEIKDEELPPLSQLRSQQQSPSRKRPATPMDIEPKSPHVMLDDN